MRNCKYERPKRKMLTRGRKAIRDKLILIKSIENNLSIFKEKRTKI